MRVLHFSDIHIGLGVRRIPPGDWPGKRMAGVANLIISRGRRFGAARRKVAALDRFRREQAVDLVICSGDYTALGTEAEFRTAREAVRPLLQAPEGFVGVPGNHDLYTAAVVRERRFERHFGDTLATDLPEYRVDGPWPLARLIDGSVAVVAVNSACPTRSPWRSTGRIPAIQIEALQAILSDERLARRFVFVVTHHAPVRHDGRPDHPLHRLTNASELLRACAEVPDGAILCGHLHDVFRVRVHGVRPEVFCAGSATIEGREGVWLFDLGGDGLVARCARWNGATYAVEDESSRGPGAREATSVAERQAGGRAGP